MFPSVMCLKRLLSRVQSCLRATVIISEIKNLEAQLQAKRELALKLKGALEAIDIMDPPPATEETAEAVAEAEPVAAE